MKVTFAFLYSKKTDAEVESIRDSSLLQTMQRTTYASTTYRRSTSLVVVLAFACQLPYALANHSDRPYWPVWPPSAPRAPSPPYSPGIQR